MRARLRDGEQLTGAFEVDDRGRVVFETKGGSVSLGSTLEQEVAGLVRGRHFTQWPEVYKQLKREGRVDEALALILECRDATEREAALTGQEPAPAYTEAAAIIYRQRGALDDEVRVIERYFNACPPGRGRARLEERLLKARGQASRDGDDR
jgi:putative intracellular protease/amidase